MIDRILDFRKENLEEGMVVVFQNDGGSISGLVLGDYILLSKFSIPLENIGDDLSYVDDSLELVAVYSSKDPLTLADIIAFEKICLAEIVTVVFIRNMYL